MKKEERKTVLHIVTSLSKGLYVFNEDVINILLPLVNEDDMKKYDRVVLCPSIFYSDTSDGLVCNFHSQNEFLKKYEKYKDKIVPLPSLVRQYVVLKKSLDLNCHSYGDIKKVDFSFVSNEKLTQGIFSFDFTYFCAIINYLFPEKTKFIQNVSRWMDNEYIDFGISSDGMVYSYKKHSEDNKISIVFSSGKIVELDFNKKRVIHYKDSKRKMTPLRISAQ